MTNRQVKQLLEKQQIIIEELSKGKGKDNWDKLATLSTFLSSIVIGIIGIYFANAYKSQEIAFKAQEVRIAETQVVEKFVPILAGNDENAKKGALLAIASLNNKDLAIRLGTSYASAGTIEAMEILFKDTEGESKKLLRDSLIDALYSRASTDTISYDQMVSDVNKIFELKPKEELRTKWDGYFLANCYRRRAYAYGGLEKYDLAFNDLQESLKIIPNYFNSYWDLGALYRWRNDSEKSLEKALEYYDLAVTHKATGNIFFERGQLHRELNNIDKALADLEKYLNFRPSDPQGYYEMALAYMQKKDFGNAHHNLKKAHEYASNPIQQPMQSFDPNQQAIQALIGGKIEEIERQMGIGKPSKIEQAQPIEEGQSPTKRSKADKIEQAKPKQKPNLLNKISRNQIRSRRRP